MPSPRAENKVDCLGHCFGNWNQNRHVLACASNKRVCVCEGTCIYMSSINTTLDILHVNRTALETDRSSCVYRQCTQEWNQRIFGKERKKWLMAGVVRVWVSSTNRWMISYKLSLKKSYVNSDDERRTDVSLSTNSDLFELVFGRSQHMFLSRVLDRIDMLLSVLGLNKSNLHFRHTLRASFIFNTSIDNDGQITSAHEQERDRRRRLKMNNYPKIYAKK